MKDTKRLLAFKDFLQEQLKNPELKREYDKLGPRYEVIASIIEARIKTGITQKELAQKMGTTQSALARLESGNVNPSIDFLSRLFAAMGYKMRIQVS